MEGFWLVSRALLALAALCGWVYNWHKEDYPKATFWGVFFLMLMDGAS